MAGPVLVGYLDKYLKYAHALRREKLKAEPNIEERARLARMTKYYHECFQKHLDKTLKGR